jgi:catechol 2,3-dioxygenase-like lactoylglutathione lyase family enzyme
VKITVTSVLVDDQEKALRFYTDVLGFVKKTDIPVGEARWLTVVSPDQPDGPELLLEPDGHPAARPFKQALVEDGIPFTSFAVDDVRAEAERLRRLGVRFTQERLETDSVTTAVFDDTCGNLIQIASQP